MYRPTRLDHFPNVKSLTAWLEERGLPHDSGEKSPEFNQNTMLKATGGVVVSKSTSSTKPNGRSK